MKYTQEEGNQSEHESLPVRGAWIEISINIEITSDEEVAPRKGSVD